MAHSNVCNHYHCAFSTASRRRLITSDLRARLWPYLGGIARTNGVTARCIGGTDNHVHMLLSLPSTVAIAKTIQLIKGGSSKWVRDEMPDCKGFEWQEGYGAFTVSASVLPDVTRYIQDQEGHHRVRTFEEEFVALLEKHGIQYDRRYVFGYFQPSLRDSTTEKRTSVVGLPVPSTEVLGYDHSVPTGRATTATTKATAAAAAEVLGYDQLSLRDSRGQRHCLACAASPCMQCS